MNFVVFTYISKHQYIIRLKNPDTPTPTGPQMFHNAPAKTFQYAYKNREAPTPAEEMLWKALKGKQLGGYKFRRQHPISNYILDFYCHVAKLAIEIDGGYHLSEEQKQYDTNRTADLLDLGIREIRFTNSQIIHNIEKVLEDIVATISNPSAEKYLP